MATAIAPETRWRVRVWFGAHTIADYRADRALAERYAEAMRRRFAGLRVTIEPENEAASDHADPLPAERLWGVAPR